MRGEGANSQTGEEKHTHREAEAAAGDECRTSFPAARFTLVRSLLLCIFSHTETWSECTRVL
jgi:hypothetical protein